MDIIPNTQVTKGKIDKLDFIKIKNFCASKSIKGEPTEWEKNIYKSLSDKGLISRIYKGI